MKRVGSVVAVSISKKSGIPKYPQPEVEIGQYGFVGDFHAGPRRKIILFNDRQISLVSQEVLDSLNSELVTSLKPGDLSENITTQGLGYLSDITDGAIIRIGRFVTLKVTKQNDPCKNLSVYHKLLVKKIYGRRGILATVIDGVGYKIKPGEIIEYFEKGNLNGLAWDTPGFEAP